MEVVAPPGTLQQLTQRLQGHLQLLSLTVPFQVQCVLSQGKLMVLIQHPDDGSPVATEVFSTLEVAIHTLAPEFVTALFKPEAVPTPVVAQLYLRTAGERYPYTQHRFCFTPGTDAVGPPSLPDRMDDRSPRSSEAPMSETPETDSPQDDDPAIALEPEASAPLPPEPAPISSAFSSSLALIEPQVTEPSPEEPRSRLLPWIVSGMVVSVVSFLGGLSIMSRPCILGGCEPFQLAQELSQTSTQTLQTAKSWDDLRTAQQQLLEANRLLDRVPAWSARQGEANVILQDHLKQTATVNQLLAIEAKANLAIQKSQKLPQPVKDWQAIQTLWRQAITQLQAIPANSPLREFAQQRVQAYQENIASIDRSIDAERQGQRNLQAAKSAAQIAETRQASAQALNQWQLVQATWQTAVNAVRQVPSGSTSHTAAQQQLAEYEPRLAQVRDRLTQEQTGSNAYNQAIGMVRSAKASEQQGQWSRAVFLWREALNYAKQVPAGTQRYGEMQPLIMEFTTALQSAETQLNGAMALQKTRTDLDRVCAGSPKTCTYTLSSDIIRVRYTPTYETALKAAFSAGQSGDTSAMGGALQHVETLQSALQALSTNAGMPLEVYSADGSELMGSFSPTGQ
jgi:hypothetical protein